MAARKEFDPARANALDAETDSVQRVLAVNVLHETRGETAPPELRAAGFAVERLALGLPCHFGLIATPDEERGS